MHLHAAILNRLTLHSESAHQMHAREVVFEPFDAQNQREAGTEPILLRARKELLDPESKWSVPPRPPWMLYSICRADWDDLTGCCTRI